MQEAKTQEEFDRIAKSDEWVEVRQGYFEARENSRVEARENSRVEAWENSRVEAWENSRVEARENSRVEAWGNSTVEARGNSRVEAWGFSVCSLRSRFAKAKGNVYAHTKQPQTTKEWLRKYGVKISKGAVVLYKATDDNFYTQNGVYYTLGTHVVAPDWEDIAIECGKGLHFCPKPLACDQFRESKHYIACKVKVDDIRVYAESDIQYPDKVRAKECDVLYEVDRNGKLMPINNRKEDSTTE